MTLILIKYYYFFNYFLCFLFSFVKSNGYDGYTGGQNNILIKEKSINGDPSKSLLHAANIKKIPLPPIAPPRIPLFSSELREDSGNNGVNDGNIIGTGSGNSNSVSYRPVPPPVRREVRSEGECHFDITQWQMQAQSAIANAIMFDRSSGINCDECLERCSKQFQNQSTEWICRSLTYDHRWKICDLFAVNGGDSPYNLLDYEGRDYFQYMPALPPTDIEMLGINKQNNEHFNFTTINNNNNEKQKALSEIIEEINIPLNLTEEKTIINENITTSTTISEQLFPSFLSNNNNSFDNLQSSNHLLQNIEIGQQLIFENNSNINLNNLLINSSSLEEEEQSSSKEIGKSLFGFKTFEPQKDVQFNKNLNKTHLIQRPILKQQKIITNNACPKIGQISYYIEIEGKLERKNLEKIEKINEIKNEIDCLNNCDNFGGKTTTNYCNSVQWTTTKGCELFNNYATQIFLNNSNNILLFLPSNETENAKYFEKVCIEKTILKDENRRTFTAIPGYILVGHVQEVSNAGSLSECLKSCLSASVNFGFNCKSLMFYPSDQEQNCLMNSESRHTQSDVFVPEEQNVEFMIYLDLDTTQSKQRLLINNPSTINEQRRFYDSPIYEKIKKNITEEEEDEWTNWSKCLNSEIAIEMRHRYLKCRKSKDIRKCPKETIPCKKKPTIKIHRIWNSNNNNNSNNQQINEKNKFAILSECRAVRDAFGRKKCPYGMRWNVMKRESCLKPIDC